LQEESTVLGIPCLTLRENTERPVTVSLGTSTLVGRDTKLLMQMVDDVLAGRYKQGRAPDDWDGRAGERIGQEVVAFLKERS
jgi:UDP-N-acetylglucosamine 2-epimerase (non-hydrolysing)